MFHPKNATTSFGSNLTLATPDAQPTTQQNPRLTLVPAGGGPPQQEPASTLSLRFELLSVSAKKGSSFLAEASVLVLVFALLDRLILRQSIELAWIISAVGISLALLAGSIAMDVATRRWLTPS